MGQYTKNVQFNGDPNPNGDNYVWEDVNGAITAGWVTLNDNQNTGQAVFTINPWTNNRSERTRLNSSHANLSYDVFCLKTKKHRLMK